MESHVESLKIRMLYQSYFSLEQKAVLIHPSKRVNILLEKLTSGLNETGKVMVFTSTKETARDIRKVFPSCLTSSGKGNSNMAWCNSSYVTTYIKLGNSAIQMCPLNLKCD